MLEVLDRPTERRCPDGTPTPHAVRSESIDGLTAIAGEGINLAIWSRAAMLSLPSVAALAAIDDVACTLPIASIEPAMTAALLAAGYDPSVAVALAEDVAPLARVIAGLADGTAVDVRLEVVETDACRKFHADYVSVRLICSYVGVGTQWLADADAARLRGGAAVDDLTIQQLATGEVALFKGRRWSDDGAIVHRSPPIAGTGARRLVLVIDPARDA